MWIILGGIVAIILGVLGKSFSSLGAFYFIDWWNICGNNRHKFC
jgi:hypothetical protein